MKKILQSTILSSLILMGQGLTTNLEANNILIQKEKYGWKFEAKVIPKEIHYVYADQADVITFINKNLEHKLLTKKNLIMKFDTQLEEVKYDNLYKDKEKELSNLNFLKNKIQLKKNLLSKINKKLDKNLPNFTKQDMENIKSDMYFYEREIYRYNIDLQYEIEKFENITHALDKIKEKLDKKKVYLSQVYIDKIYGKEKTNIYKYDKLVKYYSLNDMYFKIELNKSSYNDMVNKMLDVQIYHNKTNIEPASLKVTETQEGLFYLIIKLNNVSEHFVQDKFDILIRPEHNTIIE